MFSFFCELSLYVFLARQLEKVLITRQLIISFFPFHQLFSSGEQILHKICGPYLYSDRVGYHVHVLWLPAKRVCVCQPPITGILTTYNRIKTALQQHQRQIGFNLFTANIQPLSPFTKHE